MYIALKVGPDRFWYKYTVLGDIATFRSLQLIACFSEVHGMLVDVFRSVVYVRPSRRHYHDLTRSGRVN